MCPQWFLTPPQRITTIPDYPPDSWGQSTGSRSIYFQSPYIARGRGGFASSGFPSCTFIIPRLIQLSSIISKIISNFIVDIFTCLSGPSVDIGIHISFYGLVVKPSTKGVWGYPPVKPPDSMTKKIFKKVVDKYLTYDIMKVLAGNPLTPGVN